MDERRALVLIGMPGAGKSTFGRAAAEAEGAAFLDTDELLARREGKSLPEILHDGAARFRAAEEAALLSLEAAEGVVATGGSAVFSTAGMKRLKRLGTIVFLHVPVEEISRRIGDGKSRGVVARDGHGVFEIFAERAPLYERWADVVLRQEGPEDGRRIVSELRDLLRRNGRN